jgi:Holliday junction DNA helicase RuvA
MLANLKGKIIDKSVAGLIVETNNIGYEVFVTDQMMQSSQIGQSVDLKIAESIREDSYSLYGFSDRQEKDFYLQLVSVSGVGPKVAMAILSADSVENLQKALIVGKVDVFKHVLGVGAKTAQRIILELKGKIDLSTQSTRLIDDKAYKALISLGYSANQANQAVRDLPDDMDTNEKVKMALKELAK